MTLSYTVQRINVFPPFQDELRLANIEGGTIEATDIVVGSNSLLTGEVSFIDETEPLYYVANIGYQTGETINVISAQGINKNIFANIANVILGDDPTISGNSYSVLEQSQFSQNITFRYELSPGQYAYLLGANVEYSYFNGVLFNSSNTPDNTYLTLNISGAIVSSNIGDDEYIYLTTDNGEVVLPPGRYANAVAVVRWNAPDSSLSENGIYSINVTYKTSSSPTIFHTTANINQNIFYNFLIPEQVLAGAI